MRKKRKKKPRDRMFFQDLRFRWASMPFPERQRIRAMVRRLYDFEPSRLARS